MSTVTDAVFFLQDSKVIKEMMMTEFEALLDGIVQANEFQNQNVQAVYLQINYQLKIKSLVCFTIGFTDDGSIESDWNIPLNQLLQSAGRGPDLGAGVIRLVTQDQCSVPWHQTKLWNPSKALLQVLMTQVKANRLGIIVSDEAWQAGAQELDDVPTLEAEVPVLEVPILQPEAVPTAEPVVADVPELDIPVVEAVESNNDDFAGSDNYEALKMEFDAMRQAYTIKLDKLKNERDDLIDKKQEAVASLKQQAKEHVEQILQDSKQELEQKDQQLVALRNQVEHEQKRYSELKEQQVEQAALYQHEREELLEKLEVEEQQAGKAGGIDAGKIEELKVAFAKELSARIEAETATISEQLAIREVELFYRDEQMAIFKDEVQRLKGEKQSLLTDSGSKILQSMEANGITFVAFHVGVGHITLAIEDVGRYIDARNEYLAERCKISVDVFSAWQQHFAKPECEHISLDGTPCKASILRTDWAASFEPGVSDRCERHQLASGK